MVIRLPAAPFPTEISFSSKPVTPSEKVNVAVKAPLCGSLASLVMVTVGAVASQSALSVTAVPSFCDGSVSLTDKVSSPSFKPERSANVI